MKSLLLLLVGLLAAPHQDEARIFKRVPGTNWAVWSETDAMTDRTNAEAMLWSADRSVQLTFNCNNSEQRPLLRIAFRVPFDVGDSLTFVTYRIDGGTPVRALWRARGEVAIAVEPYPGDLASKFLAASSLVVRIDDRRSAPHDFTFSPAGGEGAARTVFGACKAKLPIN